MIAVVSTVYTLFLIWAAGYTFLFLACILLAPATVRTLPREAGTEGERVHYAGACGLLTRLGLCGDRIVLLATGVVQI